MFSESHIHSNTSLDREVASGSCSAHNTSIPRIKLSQWVKWAKAILLMRVPSMPLLQGCVQSIVSAEVKLLTMNFNVQILSSQVSSSF